MQLQTLSVREIARQVLRQDAGVAQCSVTEIVWLGEILDH